MKVRRRFATLVFVWGAFCFAHCLAELRSFQMPPKTIHIIHMYHKGDGPDPFPWAHIGGPIPPGASALNTGGDQNGDGWPSFNINPVTGEGECTWSRNNGGQMDIAFSETSVRPSTHTMRCFVIYNIKRRTRSACSPRRAAA